MCSERVPVEDVCSALGGLALNMWVVDETRRKLGREKNVEH